MSGGHRPETPKWLSRLLGIFCPDELQEEIEGDLLQRYQKDLARGGHRKAKRKLLWNTIKFFRPGIVFRNHISFKRNSMIPHYIALSFRSILRNKVFSLINITGLTVGLVAFILITQYVSYETGFDRHIADHEKIFRVVQQQVENGEITNKSAMTFFGIRQLVRENFPDVQTTAFAKIPIDLGITFSRDGEPIWYPGEMFQADTAFFRVFSNLLVEGDPVNALKPPGALVLSQKVATSTFGNERAVGKTLGDLGDNDNDNVDFEVKGVFRDLPSDSHMHFDAVIPMDRSWDTLSNYWIYPGAHTYIKINDNTHANDIESRLKEISIRKVLGASVTGIVALLSKNSIKVVMISLIIAVPLAYYGASQWLLNYPVRINMTAMPFIVAAISIVLLTFVASAVQTFKAAQSNPVDHLKNE